MNNDSVIVYLLSGIAFLCFMPLIGAMAKKKPQKPLPLVTISCETPSGWKRYETTHYSVFRNGVWHFNTQNSEKIEASNCFKEGK